MDKNPKDKTDADAISQKLAREHFEFLSIEEHRREFYEAMLGRLHSEVPNGEREPKDDKGLPQKDEVGE